MSRDLTWLERRFEPIDNAALVVFRVLFGVLLVVESAGAIATGWVTRAHVAPTVRFPIVGFEWVPYPPGDAMYAYYGVMAVLALLVTLGVAFRASMLAFFVLWSGAYVVQTAHYNNHYYLIALLCLLLATTPADGDFSVAARSNPSRRTNVCPRWCVDIFVWQTAIVFGFAAYAKVSVDWLTAKPLTIWLREMARTRSFGAELYAEPWLPWVLAWGGLAFDALVVPLLLWPRTRRFAFLAACAFHVFNSVTFRVGVFPYLGIVLCIFFFPPESIRRVLLRRAGGERAAGDTSAPATSSLDAWRLVGTTLFAVYFALQMFLPLRHHLYPGSVDWHEEGYRMAWRMMLRSKSGRVRFRVVDADTGEISRIDPKGDLTPHQAVRIAERPDMIWHYARRLSADFRRRGHPHVEVYADSSVSLNGRPRAPLIDPTVDLAAVPWRFLRYNSFVTPRPVPPAGK